MIYFGEDLGAGANKLYGPQGGLQIVAQVSAASRDRVTGLAGLRQRKPPMLIQVDGMRYYVGLNSHDWGTAIENMDYSRMTGTPEMRAIMYASLSAYMREYGEFSEPIGMVVGLPLEPLSGEDAPTNAESVKRWLLGEHSWETDGKIQHVQIAEIRVTSQPTGALFDYLLDDKGSFISSRRAHFDQEVGILSIGFNTIELLTIKDRAPVQSMTAGRTLGVRRLLELVNRDGLYTLGELDSRLRSGRLDVRRELPIWASEVSGQIEKIWGKRWRRFAQIVAVGGGAVLLGDDLVHRFDGQLFIPAEPILSTSRGLFKQALMTANRKKHE